MTRLPSRAVLVATAVVVVGVLLTGVLFGMSTILSAVVVAIGVNGAVYALAAIGLNLHFGYTGLLNFGHAAFMMVGAYGLAVTVDKGGGFWVGVLVGVVAAAALGLLLGFPTLRLRADYLAIVTIAASEILRLLFRSSYFDPVTRSVFGIQGFANAFYDLNPYQPRTYSFLGLFAFRDRTLWLVTVGWAVALVGTAVVWLLVRSPWGRVLRSIREDEDAARSLGKNVFGYKLQSLVVGGIFGGLGGMLLAIDFQNVNPDAFLPILTFFVYVVVILGGPGTVWGPIVGSVMFWFLIEVTRGIMSGLVARGWVSGAILSSQDVAAVRFVLVGLFLLVMMAYRPQGVFGSREEMLLDAR
ncbi:MAG TPA: branched-chain amino acid ABC transporter permease [Nitriliruptorales bacterium]|nr:branched-chain amino acid ABC transporter permease [Nitriliruptorales bacterium]